MLKRKASQISKDTQEQDITTGFVFRKKVKPEYILKAPLVAVKGVCPLSLLTKNNHRLPSEMWFQVFAFLNYNDHCILMQVCTRWRGMASESIMTAKIEVKLDLFKSGSKMMTPGKKCSMTKNKFGLKKRTLFSSIKAGI